MRRILPYVFLLFFANRAVAQLIVDPSYTPQQLVEDVLVGQGVEVSNFSFTGNVEARGYFDGSNSNIGVSEGVIISTGRVVDAPGPNETPTSDFGTEFFGPGNLTLSSIVGSPTFDAAMLEFDFEPKSDTVQFKYVFASNEYMDWVGAGVNDVFAFLISGPGISGEMNVALIPGTTTPVAIDNVNANTNDQYYTDNENPPGSTVEYNGFTTVFTAVAVLEACQTYHIKLAIADGGDEQFDSAVFLEAGSFSSPSISINAESSYSASVTQLELVEGCSQMTLDFERSEPFDNPLTVGLNFSGSITNGVDITSIPPFITFPAGQSTTSISFNVLEDGEAEGVEDMIISLDQLNPCASGDGTSIEFTVEDVVPIGVQISPDTSLDCPQEILIEASVSDGYQPYSYTWSGLSDVDESISVFPYSTSAYTVNVTDACGFTQSATSTVSILTYEIMEVSLEDVTVCKGDDAMLQVSISGGRQPRTILWPDGSSDEVYSYTPSQTEQITVQVTDDCAITESATAKVTVNQVVASFTHQLVAHATVEFNPTTTDVFNFFWEFGDDSTGVRENAIHEYAEAGDYPVSLTVINQSGCDTTLYDTVTVYDPLHVYIPNAFTPNGDSLNDWFGMVGEGYLYYDMAIYDRWGKILIEGRFTDEKVWDGTFNGRPVPTGLYAYKVWVEPPIGIEVKEVGVVRVLSGN